jgi:polysaccharide deacetylase family protein (PEP-CTERM system associated)
MDIISFDIEEWYIEKHFSGNREQRYRDYDECLEKILSILETNDTKATFFCVGAMGREFPTVIRKIADAGHDIGCHSDTHTWLSKMTREELNEDCHSALESLRQCIGKDVDCFRAPAFSIGQDNSWAFGILYENGVRIDSSIFPATRDFGGFAEFGTAEPALVEFNGCTVKEFPICLAKIVGKEIAYSGGGYFRFFPYHFIKKHITNSNYAISYFHINDLLKERDGLMKRKDYEEYFKEPGTLSNRINRYIKGNLGKGGALRKMSRLIENLDYVSMSIADKAIDWDVVNKISL